MSGQSGDSRNGFFGPGRRTFCSESGMLTLTKQAQCPFVPSKWPVKLTHNDNSSNLTLVR